MPTQKRRVAESKSIGSPRTRRTRRHRAPPKIGTSNNCPNAGSNQNGFSARTSSVIDVRSILRIAKKRNAIDMAIFAKNQLLDRILDFGIGYLAIPWPAAD